MDPKLLTEKICLSYGCLWDDTIADNNISAPSCYFPPNTGYIVDGVQGDSTILKKDSNSIQCPYGKDGDEFEILRFTVKEIGAGLHIVIEPINAKRSVPNGGNYDNMTETMRNFYNYGIPIDVVTLDIDYMDKYKDFTFDKKNWSGLPALTEKLHNLGLKLEVVLDPGVEPTTDGWKRAQSMDASFVEWASQDLVPKHLQEKYPLVKDSKIMLYASWPDFHVAAPDFLDPLGKTAKWWASELEKFHESVDFDAIWLDLNEPSSFSTNVKIPWFWKNLKWHSKIKPLFCPLNNSKLEIPPYRTVSLYWWEIKGRPKDSPATNFLSSKTLCMEGRTGRGKHTVYDTHNIYGLFEAMASSEAVKKATGKRGLVVARFVVIPTTKYTHFRNHNHGEDEKDPAQWESVAIVSRKSNLFRYRHLPYLYSLLFSASIKGGTVIRPLFFEFPEDLITWNINFEFLWGSKMLVMPVVYPGAENVTGYLPPNAKWFSLYDYNYGSLVKSGYNTFPTPVEFLIPVFIRGGSIIPRQRPGMTTVESRKNEFQLVIAPDYGIPIDVVTLDIDYMDKYKGFTFDKKNWSGLPALAEKLHSLGLKLEIVLDPGVEPTTDGWKRAQSMDASFIEWASQDFVPKQLQEQYPFTKNSKVMLYASWPEFHVAAPDFLDPSGKTAKWWTSELERFHESVAFDSIWLDVNEPSSFATNEKIPWFWSTSKWHSEIKPLFCQLNQSKLEIPPYRTVSMFWWENEDRPGDSSATNFLSTKTLCMEGRAGRGQHTIYDTHNIYGLYEAMASSEAIKRATGKRGLVMARFVVIPTTKYTHFRNHNHGKVEKDPAQWVSVAKASRKANLFRYRHLPYLYSLHFSSSIKGGTVIRPLFFEFPEDPITWNINFEFLWGSKMLILPVVYPGATTVSGYLPTKAKWFSLYDYNYGGLVKSGNNTFPASVEFLIPVFVRGGSIIPRQRSGMTTVESRKNEFQLLIAPDTIQLDGRGINEKLELDRENHILNITSMHLIDLNKNGPVWMLTWNNL
uniref:P-type domain-containing protein n=1 Tax=Acrobeloides nanus TaxID=290746 RepID=A0A914CFN9_9BILA